MSNFALLETILYTPTQRKLLSFPFIYPRLTLSLYTTGFYLLDLHIGRLLRSAAEFHDRDPSLFTTIPSPDAIRQSLHESVPNDDTFKRVRTTRYPLKWVVDLIFRYVCY